MSTAKPQSPGSPVGPSGAGGALLEVDQVTVKFGGIIALDGLSFTVDRGQLCALIGPNGAGKTTFFNVVSRIYLPTTGHVRFDGRDLLQEPAHRIAKVGITRTFQNLALFPGLSVLQNVMEGGHSWTKGGFLGAMFYVPQQGADRTRRAEAFELLERLNLAQHAHRPCAGLPYGTLKRIELARALASRPKLLMLDEPASGLTHAEVDELGQMLLHLKQDYDLSLLLVEHHMGMVMSISQKVVVMEFGKKIAEGLPQEVANDPKVIEAYLGAPTS